MGRFPLKFAQIYLELNYFDHDQFAHPFDYFFYTIRFSESKLKYKVIILKLKLETNNVFDSFHLLSI